MTILPVFFWSKNDRKSRLEGRFETAKVEEYDGY